jgi:hypothetical protein
MRRFFVCACVLAAGWLVLGGSMAQAQSPDGGAKLKPGRGQSATVWLDGKKVVNSKQLGEGLNPLLTLKNGERISVRLRDGKAVGVEAFDRLGRRVPVQVTREEIRSQDRRVIIGVCFQFRVFGHTVRICVFVVFGDNLTLNAAPGVHPGLPQPLLPAEALPTASSAPTRRLLA